MYSKEVKMRRNLNESEMIGLAAPTLMIFPCLFCGSFFFYFQEKDLKRMELLEKERIRFEKVQF